MMNMSEAVKKLNEAIGFLDSPHLKGTAEQVKNIVDHLNKLEKEFKKEL